MKQAIIAITVALLILLPGCSTGKQVKTVDVQQVADELMGSIQFQDQMTELKQQTAIDIFGIPSDDVVKAAVYESTGATAEEVAVFESKDEQAAERVKEKAEDRIETQKAGFKDYVPEEMEKLQNPVLKQYGKYVVLCVSNDSPSAKEIIEGFFS